MTTKNDKQTSQERRLDHLEEYYFNLDKDPESFEEMMIQLKLEAKEIWNRMNIKD